MLQTKKKQILKHYNTNKGTKPRSNIIKITYENYKLIYEKEY